jgi:hypothetical protein
MKELNLFEDNDDFLDYLKKGMKEREFCSIRETLLFVFSN